jgi:heme exporter protein A
MRLSASDLALQRGGRQIFAGLSFSVAEGETLLVTGPNGAGKSSLLRIVAGLLRLSEGLLTLADGAAELTIPEQVHYLGHQDALKPSLSVAENLQFWTDYLGGGGTPVDTALAALGLDDLALLPAAYLSAGQRRRLSIARLLTVDRPIWLLDEPTAALDRPAQQKLADLMLDHLGRGGLILAATHAPIGIAAARELRLGDAA